jgi:hypothetical protein
MAYIARLAIAKTEACHIRPTRAKTRRVAFLRMLRSMAADSRDDSRGIAFSSL